MVDGCSSNRRSLADLQQLAAHRGSARSSSTRRELRLRQQARLEVLQQDRVQLRDALRRLVVALHHRFARAPMRRVGVAELRGERRLYVEDDAVLAPAGEVMQPDAQVLQQPLVLRELARLVALDQALARRARAQRRAHAGGAGDPLDDLQVAQPARALP